MVDAHCARLAREVTQDVDHPMRMFAIALRRPRPGRISRARLYRPCDHTLIRRPLYRSTEQTLMR